MAKLYSRHISGTEAGRLVSDGRDILQRTVGQRNINSRQASQSSNKGLSTVITIASRPRSVTVVEAVSAEPTAVQRPPGTIADGNLDEECGVYRSRIEVVDLADVCLVKR